MGQATSRVLIRCFGRIAASHYFGHLCILAKSSLIVIKMEANQGCSLKEGERAICTLAYEAQSKHEVTLAKDAVVVVKSTFSLYLEEGKVLVSFEGKDGLFPLNFLALHHDPEAAIVVETSEEATQEETDAEKRQKKLAKLGAVPIHSIQFSEQLAEKLLSKSTENKAANKSEEISPRPPEPPLQYGSSTEEASTPTLPTGLLAAIQSKKTSMRKVEEDEGYVDGTSKETGETMVMKDPLLAEVERKVAERVPSLNIEAIIANNKNQKKAANAPSILSVLQDEKLKKRLEAQLKKQETAETVDDIDEKIKAKKQNAQEEEENHFSYVLKKKKGAQKCGPVDIAEQQADKKPPLLSKPKKMGTTIDNKPEIEDELQSILGRRLSIIDDTLTTEIKEPAYPALAPKPKAIPFPPKPNLKKKSQPPQEDMQETCKSEEQNQRNELQIGSVTPPPHPPPPQQDEINEYDSEDLPPPPPPQQDEINEYDSKDLPPPPLDFLQHVEMQQSVVAESANTQHFEIASNAPPPPPPLPPIAVSVDETPSKEAKAHVQLSSKSSVDTRRLLEEIRTGVQLKSPPKNQGPPTHFPTLQRKPVSLSTQESATEHMREFAGKFREYVADSDEDSDDSVEWVDD